MRTSTRRNLALCAVLASLTLTGCGTNPDPVTPTGVESWSADDEAQAIKEAEQAIRDYWQVRAQCLADPPNTDPSCFEQVAYGELLTSDQTALKDAQDYGIRYLGSPIYVETDRIVSVDLSIGPDKEVQLSACTDRESSDVTMPDGTSIKPSDTPRRVQSIYVVRKHASEWQIADIFDDPEGIEC